MSKKIELKEFAVTVERHCNGKHLKSKFSKNFLVKMNFS